MFRVFYNDDNDRDDGNQAFGRLIVSLTEISAAIVDDRNAECL